MCILFSNFNMEFSEVVKKRQSVRAYKDKEIEEKDLAKLLEIVNLAPSAGNLQAYHVIVVKDSEKRSLLANAAYGQGFVKEAPVVLVFIAMPGASAGRYSSRGRELYSVQDATIAASYAQLAATNLGLATCWVGAFDESRVKKILDLSSDSKPIAILPLGYAAEKPYRTSRRRIDEGVRYL